MHKINLYIGVKFYQWSNIIENDRSLQKNYRLSHKILDEIRDKGKLNILRKGFNESSLNKAQANIQAN